MSTGKHNGRPANSQGGREVRVALGARGYTVLVEAGALERTGPIVAGLVPGVGRAFVVFDQGLPTETTDGVVSSLGAAGLKTSTIGIRPTERAKSLATLGEILSAMARERLERREPVIALGGGIVGDLAGMAAAVYRRGVPVVQCPSTLLAMVDASVGGKTGVNLDLGTGAGHEDLKKNMVGVFHQPLAVVADVDVLASLPARDFRSGLAECVKHGMLSADWGDPGLLDWTEAHLAQALSRDRGTLVELVARNVGVKAAVVGKDEREEAGPAEGGRALLNLGHTFAHAIETLPGLSPDGDPRNAPLQHGEAVALGLVAACRCAEAMNPALRAEGIGDRVVGTLGRIGLPTGVKGLPGRDRVLELMTHDKKVSAGVLRLVLPSAPGSARVVDGPPEAALAAAIDAIRR